MTDPTLREMLKLLIASAAIVLVLVYLLYDARKIQRGRRVLAAALAMLALASAAAYLEFGWLRYGMYMNPHDFFHYYTGSKYAEEIGYHDQYRAALVADMEGASLFDPKSSIRNLKTHGFSPAQKVLKESTQIKGLFSEERWAEFSKDIGYFQSLVYKKKWNTMLRDKGFNGTPLWVMTAGFLTNRIPTHDPFGMKVLVALDLLLIALMLFFVWAAFGPRVMLFAVIFFGTNFTMSFVHIKGGLLRLDWVALLVISLCLMKLKRYKTAGACMAYAAMARIFPAIFLFGFGAQALWDLFRTRTVERKYIEFFVAFALVAAALLGLTVIDAGGTGQWEEFLGKITLHNKDISTTRVGFKYIFLYPFERFGEKVRGFEEHRTAWWAIQAAVLLFAFFAVRRLEDYETIPFGFLPAFFLAAPTFYYYVMLIVPLFLFLPKASNTGRALGLCLMFLFSIVAYLLHLAWPINFFLCFLLSCGLLLLCGYLSVVALFAAPVSATQEGTQAAVTSARRARWPLAAALLLLICAVLFVSWRPKGVAPAFLSRGSGEAVLALAGDVMLSRNVARSLKKYDRGFAYPFAPTAPYTTEADIAFCNLESPISGKGKALKKKYLFNAPPEAVTGLVSAGFDVVSLANNHILDYGTVAMSDTLMHLSQVDIRAVGLFHERGMQKPAILNRQGLRIGFLAYADRQGAYAYPKSFLAFKRRPAEAKRSIIARDVDRLKRDADIIVVSLHWGVEYQDEPSERQRALARFVIDRGAHIIAGHHPHVQQEPEWYNGGLILYSMGNFVFDQHTRPKTRLSRLYRVYVTKAGVARAEYLPLEIRRADWQTVPTGGDFVPVPMPGATP